MEEEEVERIIKEILATDVNDGIEMMYDKIGPILEDDDYNNFRVYFFAKYGKINNPMKIDITVGDEITPAAIEYHYKTIFSDSDIDVKAYNLETILAEKYESVISKNIATTRARDFYDLHVLYRIYRDKINYKLLAYAVQKTSGRRGTLDDLAEWRDICDEMRDEPALLTLWKQYCNDNMYAADIQFSDTIDTVISIGEQIAEVYP